MRVLRQRNSQIKHEMKSLRKTVKTVKRVIDKSGSALEKGQAKVDEIALHAKVVYKTSSLTIRRYAVKEAEIPIRQVVSKAPCIDIDSVAAKVRHLECTIARLSGLHAHVLSSIKQSKSRAMRKQYLRRPRIRRHMVRSTSAREQTHRRRIIASARKRKLRKISPRRVRYINKLNIQRHPTYPEQRPLRLEQRFAKIRRIGQSRPRGSIEPRKQKKQQLLQTVTSWLEGTTATSTSVKPVGRVRKRPFGSRAVGSDDELGEDGNESESDGGKSIGLELLMDTADKEEGRVRRGSRS